MNEPSVEPNSSVKAIYTESYINSVKENELYEISKRIFDIIFSLFLFIITLPFIIVSGLLIKLESRGPVLYKQDRLGQYGKVFTLYKLRSMYIDAEKNGAVWAEKDDPRVTKIGKFIRKTRLDEIPQLFNVLKGDMSIIGPRPERPELTYEFEKDIPGFINRLSVKPGITGWAQINGGYDITPREKYLLDMNYIRNRDWVMDAYIILKTIKVVLTGDGAR